MYDEDNVLYLCVVARRKGLRNQALLPDGKVVSSLDWRASVMAGHDSMQLHS